MSDSPIAAAAVERTARLRTTRGPRRSSTGPRKGEAIAARIPPSDTAPEIAVRDQPNSPVIGATKIDSTATDEACRAKPAQHTQPRMTHP
jgi:hypothetical protein